MRHPDERQIALYAGGEAGWMERLSVGRHVGQCASCRELAEAYLGDRQQVRSAGNRLPDGMTWDRLAAEMTGNIRVGLAAGECVGGPERARGMAWRPALAAAGVAALLISGWYLRIHPAATMEAGISLESTRNGIQVSENGSALTLMHPGSAMPVVVVSTRGSLRARYVDSDTGQVTITNVYSQ